MKKKYHQQNANESPFVKVKSAELILQDKDFGSASDVRATYYRARAQYHLGLYNHWMTMAITEENKKK